MKAAFLSLNPRERWLVSGGGLLLLLVFGYVLVAEPFLAAMNSYRTEAAAQRADLLWMRQAASEIEARRKTGGSFNTGETGSPLAVIDQQAREMGLAGSLQRVEPDGEAVRVWLMAAIFDDLLRWLQVLQAEAGLAVRELTVEVTGQAGLVDARLTLVPGAEKGGRIRAEPVH